MPKEHGLKIEVWSQNPLPLLLEILLHYSAKGVVFEVPCLFWNAPRSALVAGISAALLFGGLFCDISCFYKQFISAITCLKILFIPSFSI